MIIYYINTTIFKDIIQKFSKKADRRDYCSFLNKAVNVCRADKNIHTQCAQLELFLKQAKC